MDPVIDLEMALRQVSDDKEFLMELLNDMVAGKDKLFESMNEAIRCNDPKVRPGVDAPCPSATSYGCL